MSEFMQRTIFTIGHSNHTIERFIALLRQHDITALGDVRSTPYSRANPHFNREDLKSVLKRVGIAYVFLGKELGARSEDASCYERGKVQYDRLALTDRFRHGLDRVQEGMKKYRLALMCAEKEPLECHRAILVGRHIAGLGIPVQHIHADGRLENQADVINRLIHQLALPEYDMFRSHEDVLTDAYKIQESRISYSVPEAKPAVRVRSATG
ncbi:MAG: DUF488 family protein [Bryobacteraceae bacterium]